MLISINLETYTHKGIEYLTVKQFASCVNRSEQTIYSLINKGNAVRKMESIKLFGTVVLVPFSEITEFPFTSSGKSSDVYHYKITPEGLITIDDNE